MSHETDGELILALRNLRVFYATLARKALSGPVGRVVIHCLEGFIR
jgi:hypothetical protein